MSVRIEFLSDGFKAILNSTETQNLLQNECDAIASRASAGLDGEGFRAHTVKAGTRWVGFVGTTDLESIRAESEDKALSRAVIPHV